MADAEILRVKRTHGLGNVILLLPVLRVAAARGRSVELATRPEWLGCVRALAPEVDVVGEAIAAHMDLDAMTEAIHPDRHRTEEFGALLGIAGPYPPLAHQIPAAWTERFEHYRGCVLVAPEAGHPARQWPYDRMRSLCAQLMDSGESVVLVGTKGCESLPCRADLTEQTTVEEVFGLVSLARCVVCMDSGIFHIAKALRTPTVAIFGGVDPRFRALPEDLAYVLQADIPCCPCNKNETCDGRYDCLQRISTTDVLAGLRELASTDDLEMIRT